MYMRNETRMLACPVREYPNGSRSNTPFHDRTETRELRRLARNPSDYILLWIIRCQGKYVPAYGRHNHYRQSPINPPNVLTSGSSRRGCERRRMRWPKMNMTIDKFNFV